jgi:hypothetical protein
MENCNSLFSDFMIGISSGLILSILLWGFHLISQSNKIIRPSEFLKITNQIKINNDSSFCKVGSLMIIGQVIFSDNGVTKRFTIKIENQFNYLSPEKLNPQSSRVFSINIEGCIPGQNFNDFNELQGEFPDSELVIYVQYLGSLTNIQKSESKSFS